MSIIWGRQCAFVFSIYVRKCRKNTIDRWIVVYTVCASAVISPLRSWLDSYAKTRLKMWQSFKHFINIQNFLLLTNLVIVFVHWVSAGVLYEPRQCCFGTIFPNLNFVFASICAARPVHIQSNQYRSCSTVKQRRAVGAAPFIPMKSNQKERCGSAFTKWHDIYTPEECADECRQNNADLKLVGNCHEWLYRSLELRCVSLIGDAQNMHN